MKGDFHIHTVYSDGVLEVRDVLKEAKKHNLDIISITDHDTVDGAILAGEIASEYDLKVLYGTELSTSHNNESVHILGYFKDINKVMKIKTILDEQRNSRIERCKNICEKLRSYYKIDLDISPLLKLHSITRGSIAREIIKQGFPYTKEEIFARFIGDGCPAYLPSTKMETIDGIKMLREVGATIILAHPVLLKKNDFREIVKMNVDGLEAIYPANTLKDTKRFKKYARSNSLLITAGSDFHDFNDMHHGNIGSVYLEDLELDRFIKRVEDNYECTENSIRGD